jgi:hypothetical protein
MNRKPETENVPHSKSGIFPRSSFVRRWAVGVLGIWGGRDSWVKVGK